jgi:hypothetical protein
MSGLTDWRQSRPKYAKGENPWHKKAKRRLYEILEFQCGFRCYEEVPFDVYCGIQLPNTAPFEKKNYSFDIYAEKVLRSGLYLKLIAETDGEYHTKLWKVKSDQRKDQLARFFIDDVVIVRLRVDELIHMSVHGRMSTPLTDNEIKARIKKEVDKQLSLVFVP